MTSSSPASSPPPSEHPSPSPGPRLRAAGSSAAIIAFAAVTLVVLVGDLALKYFSFRTVASAPVQLDPEQPGVVPPHQAVDVVPYLLSLRLTANEGAVFGLGQGGRWVFIAVSIVAVGVILYVFGRSRRDAWVFHLGLALILGGALGNLYDRVRYAAVRDMLWLLPDLGLWPWIFNLADAALVVGVTLVIAVMWVHELRQRKAEAASR